MLSGIQPKLLILGAGGYGQAVAELADLSGKWSEILFADDQWPDKTQVNGYKIISDIKNLVVSKYLNCWGIAAVGNNTLRKEWHAVLEDLGIQLATLIHPNTTISPSAKIGRGVTIMAGCVLSSNIVINDGVILNIGTLLDHDVTIQEYAHLSVGVGVAGGKVIDGNSFLDVGTFVIH